jgi:rhodanese-related sulfurtransferase
VRPNQDQIIDEVTTMAPHHSEAFVKLVNEAKQRVKEEDFRATKKRLDAGEKIVLIDTREDSEWAAGHIPGAAHLSKGIIERDIDKIVADKDATVVLYCGGGYRSALAADNLQKMGYRNVISMDGGWRGWTEAGFPVIKE